MLATCVMLCTSPKSEDSCHLSFVWKMQCSAVLHLSSQFKQVPRFSNAFYSLSPQLPHPLDLCDSFIAHSGKHGSKDTLASM